MDNQKTYTAADIHQYLSGKMDATQMHAIEKAALDNPLLAEAIEGYNLLPGFKEPQGLENISDDLNELKDKVNSGAGNTGVVKKMNNWWRAAAAILLLLGGTVLAIFINNSLKTDRGITVAKTETPTTPVKTEEIKDTNAQVPQLNKEEKPQANVDNQKAKAKIIIPDKNAESKISNDDEAPVVSFSAKDNKAPAPVVAEKQSSDRREYDIEVASSQTKKERSLYKKSELNKAPKIIFSGKVIDKNNNPIPFVTLTASNGLTSTTDKKGEFSLGIAKENNEKVTFKATNFQSKSIDASNGYQVIVLDMKKIITDKNSNGHLGQALVLDHKGAEPKEGWPKYISFLVEKISYSEYDTGKPVIGETIVSFEIDQHTVEPVNFIFEKEIDSDVNEAIQELITNGPEWRIIDGTLPNRIRLKLNF